MRPAPEALAVRPETATDIPAVRAVVAAAFGQEAEARLVDALRAAGALAVSLVAELDGQVAGHIAFSPMVLEGAACPFPILGLAPLAVAPGRQRRGAGSLLVRQGLAACRAAGCGLVLVLGNPDYYCRFGFVPARPLGLECPYPAPDEAWMALELLPGLRPGRPCLACFRPEFDAPDLL